MRSILIVTRHTPLPWEDGAGAYLHDLARFLARSGFRVDVLWLAPHEHFRWQKIWRLPSGFDRAVRLLLPHSVRWGRRYLFPGMIWHPLKANALHRAKQLLAAIGLHVPRRQKTQVSTVPSAPRPWMSPPSVDELALVETFVRRLRPDVVIASYAWMCPLFELPALQSVHRACLTHDIAWKRAQLVAANACPGVAPEVSRDNEANWLSSATTLIAISESDATELRAMVPAAKVLAAPKACEPNPRSYAESAGSDRRLLFVGSGNSFNVEGLEWFLREVWPLILQDQPGAELDVVGSIAPAVRLRPSRCHFHGPVPDLAPFYERAAVIIVPLLRATGLNIKLIEAAGFGRAIVATPVTLAGAPFLREVLLTADTPALFAHEVLRLLEDPSWRKEAGDRNLAAVEAQLAPEICYRSVVDTLLDRNSRAA